MQESEKAKMTPYPAEVAVICQPSPAPTGLTNASRPAAQIHERATAEIPRKSSSARAQRPPCTTQRGRNSGRIFLGNFVPTTIRISSRRHHFGRSPVSMARASHCLMLLIIGILPLYLPKQSNRATVPAGDSKVPATHRGTCRTLRGCQASNRRHRNDEIGSSHFYHVDR